MCGTGPDSECSPKNFLFSNTEAWRLYSPENEDCKGVKIFYLVWRWVWTVIFLATFILSLVNTADEGAKWLIFLTNWAYTAFCAGQLINAIVVTVEFTSPEKSSTVRWYMKINWIFYEMSQVVAVLITIMYWTLLYDPADDPLSVHTYFNHGVNGAFVLLDIWVTAMPIKALHFYVSALFGLAWVIFAVIYDFSGGTDPEGKPYIYSVFDWTENPTMSAVFTIAAIAVAIVLHFLLFGLYKLRVFIYSRCCARSSPTTVTGGKIQRYNSVETAEEMVEK